MYYSNTFCPCFVTFIHVASWVWWGEQWRWGRSGDRGGENTNPSLPRGSKAKLDSSLSMYSLTVLMHCAPCVGESLGMNNWAVKQSPQADTGGTPRVTALR